MESEAPSNIPGTVHLVDVDGQIRGRHGRGSERDIILVPSPSIHPGDPLNWSRPRKLLSAFCMAIYVLVIGICSSSLYSTLDPLSRVTGLSLGNLNAGTGYMFLLLGWGCIFWQAVALQYGKRPVYLITLLGTLGIMIWQPYTKSNGQWIAAKILQGFFGSPMESLPEISVSDVFFTHERGRYMAVYALALGYSNGIAPLIMGFINMGQGWRWVFYWCAIFCGFTFIFCFFFMEETNYHREPTGEPHTLEPCSESLSKSPKNSGADKAGGSTAGSNEEQSGQTIIPDKSYWRRLLPFQAENLHHKNQLAQRMIRPIIFLSFPVIFYAGFSYGVYILWLAILNATESLVFSGEPYNFSTAAVGITFIAPLIGTTLASGYVGVFGDRLVIRLARRNKGVMEAEHRLWLFLVCLVLLPFGCILWGVGAYHSIHWFGLVFAMGTISFITTAGSQIWVTYCIDCYSELGAEALVTVIIIRNTIFFACSYGFTPWVLDLRYQNAFILAAFIGFGYTLTVFPWIKWGKILRKRSQPRYSHYLKDAQQRGLSH